jgi:phosphoribosyl-ATP pyrophosphohydrolase
MDAKVLDDLTSLIAARAAAKEATSYTARLLQQGKGTIARKVGEEAVELIVASLAEGEKEFVNESADVLYHWLVLCQAMNIKPEKIYQTLRERMENGKAEK